MCKYIQFIEISYPFRKNIFKYNSNINKLFVVSSDCVGKIKS